MSNEIRNMDHSISFFKKITRKLIAYCLLLIPFFISCQKDLVLKTGISEPKQVIIANLYPNSRLEVNISQSKHPDDFGAIDFLPDCKVDLYEDGVFKETLAF